MGYIKEPIGIDFIVDSAPITAIERQKISDIITYYKTTGKKTFLLKKNVKADKTVKRKIKQLS
jgi:hypothetical protein